MQPTIVHPRDRRLVAVAAAVAVGVILAALAWTFWPGVSSTTTPSTIPITTSSSTVGMGDLRAVDVISSSRIGMGDLRAAEAVGGRAVGMGDLRALEGESNATARAAPTIGMGDVRADRLPGGSLPQTPYVGMGDVHSVE